MQMIQLKNEPRDTALHFRMHVYSYRQELRTVFNNVFTRSPQACLRVGHIQHLLKHVVSYIVLHVCYMGKCKVQACRACGFGFRLTSLYIEYPNEAFFEG